MQYLQVKHNLKRSTPILHIIYALLVSLFICDNFTSFEIKSQAIKSFIYITVLLGAPILLIWNVTFLKDKRSKILSSIFPAFVLILILILNPIKIVYAKSAWRTQTLLYKNKHHSNKTIEFQMQDVGALGYNKRTVEVLYLSSAFIIIHEMPNEIDLKNNWIKVDQDINELELKFP